MIQLQDPQTIVENQRRFFETGETRDIEFRLQQLRKFKEILEKNESRIYQALREDLGKPSMESYTGELGVLLVESNHTLRHLTSWARTRKVGTPISLFPSKSEIRYEPRGVVLIMGPWNYPLQLLFDPLIGAIAAGNCAVLKPSELAPASSHLTVEIVRESFPPEYVAVLEGGREIGEALLNQQFDYIFFTGGEKVGKIVAAAAARNITPVTLELGGKSPCIVDQDFALDVTARRIVWGKYFNAGQSCVAPDYLLVPQSRKKELLDRMIQNIDQFFGRDPIQSPDFGRIINKTHFDRLEKFLANGTVLAGGQTDRDQLYIAPTILDDVSMEDEVMGEEIFGPILPVLEYKNIEEAIRIVRQRPDPLAFYIFSSNKDVQERFLNEIPFGGGCVNNTLVHFTNPNLPFGGIRSSGMGAYHGEASFQLFSHRKGIVNTPLWTDIKIRYQPYLNKLKLVKRFMK